MNHVTVRDSHALAAQRQRAKNVRARLLEFGRGFYDPNAALIRSYSFGHVVAEASLQYALLLIDSVPPTPQPRSDGSGDHRESWWRGPDEFAAWSWEEAGRLSEANRILRAILNNQDVEPASATFGNFKWRPHWATVKDLNAVSFLASGLAHAYMSAAERLDPTTRRALEERLPMVLAGVRRHKVPWQYTNIFFLNLSALVTVGRAIGDPSAEREARDDLRQWLEGTGQEGFHEFNSPTYTPLGLYALEAAWTYVNDAELRNTLQRTLDLFAYLVALNMLPNGFLGGAAARAYRFDALYGTGMSAFYGHVKFGTPLLPDDPQRISLLSANVALFDYVPPEPVRQLATHKPELLEVHDRLVRPDNRRAHFITSQYSIASQSAADLAHPPPPYVVIVRNSGDLRRSIVLLADESFGYGAAPAFHSRQWGSTVVGRLRYVRSSGVDGANRDEIGTHEPRLLLGLRSDIRDVRVNGVAWTGSAIRLRPGHSVAVSYGDVYLGILADTVGPDGKQVSRELTLEYGVDAELRVRFKLGGAPERPPDPPADLLLLIDAVEGSTPFDDYVGWLGGWKLSSSGDLTECTAANSAGRRLTSIFSQSDPDPLGAALHLSPYFRLSPGDLPLVISGSRPLPLVVDPR
jgi:hypothetical protein